MPPPDRFLFFFGKRGEREIIRGDRHAVQCVGSRGLDGDVPVLRFGISAAYGDAPRVERRVRILCEQPRGRFLPEINRDFLPGADDPDPVPDARHDSEIERTETEHPVISARAEPGEIDVVVRAAAKSDHVVIIAAVPADGGPDLRLRRVLGRPGGKGQREVLFVRFAMYGEGILRADRVPVEAAVFRPARGGPVFFSQIQHRPVPFDLSHEFEWTETREWRKTMCGRIPKQL